MQQRRRDKDQKKKKEEPTMKQHTKGRREEEEEDDDDEEDVYDSGDEQYNNDVYDSEEDEEKENDSDDDDSEGEESSSDDEEFEDQGSSSDDESDDDDDESEDGLEMLNVDDAGNHRPGSTKEFMFDESKPRQFGSTTRDEKLRTRLLAAQQETKQKSSSTSSSSETKKEDDKEQNFQKDDIEKRSEYMHTDDLSSDDDDPDGTQNNRIGAVPLHWYDEYDHIGYNIHGKKVGKSTGTDGDNKVTKSLRDADGKSMVVYDALNDKEVPIDERQLELIKRIQSGRYAHPEHEAYPTMESYFSGINQEISGLHSNTQLPKRRFLPSKYEGMMVRDLLKKLQRGQITMEYLKGELRDMNDVKDNNQKEHSDDPRPLWDGSEIDEIALRKGPMQLVAPKVAPPGHAESYNPSEEYLPTEEELQKWKEMDVKDRPYGLFVPTKYPNLRSVGAYEHSVRETFERCLDLYLAPRSMKRRLNIDPESLVPSVPKASDLRPFPTTECVQYITPHDDDVEPPMIRCLTVSGNGQYMASGATDGYVRLWEVSTGRLFKSWNVSNIVKDLQKDLFPGATVTTTTSDTEKNDETKKGDDDDNDEKDTSTNETPLPVTALEWNPNKSYHCLIASVGYCVIVLATGTGGVDIAQMTDDLVKQAASTGSDGKKGSKEEDVKDSNDKSNPEVVQWISLVKRLKKSERTISAFGGFSGPVIALFCDPTKGGGSTDLSGGGITYVKWHKGGDYFLSINPKATNGTSTLIHRLSKSISQQPFKKSFKGGSSAEVQCACFHPTKPFLFVATKQHVRIYHLLQQTLVKRLISGCKWISSIDIHTSGDHLIIGSLDRKTCWFDLDLGERPYKQFKYHTRSIRCVSFSERYPLFATSSDDGTTHIFHGMVYSDFIRNPLLVPVKILKGHHTCHVGKQKLGILSMIFHPTQPWLFTGGADGIIHLMQDI